MKAMTVAQGLACVAAVLALVFASPANAKSKRAASEAGPLVMSGTMVPATMARRSRSVDICRPVTVRVR